jgi:hypothetical protein
VEPDIEPMRLSAIDVACLSNTETRAVMVLLAGDPDPVVTEALIDAVRKVLARTRGSESQPPGGV